MTPTEQKTFDQMREALDTIIQYNRDHARDQYGDAEKAERWACVVKARQALTAANAVSHPQATEPAWQPIESAPKDGRDIIVYFKTVGIRQVSWCDEYGDPSGKYAIWRVDDNKHGPYPLRGYRDGDDTHWMHLPTPPEAKA